MHPSELIVGTADGIRRIRVDESGDATIICSGLHGETVRGIAIDPRDPATIYVAAGLRGWGLHRSRDGGQNFECLGFEDSWCWDIAIDRANPDRLLLGTEPPMLWESLDSGETWRNFPSIDSVSSRSNWTFFHAPFHAGHLHGIALSDQRPDRIIVGVEHGGLLVSQDAGETWNDTMPGADLHRIVIDPAEPDRVYAGAGNGLFLSEDGGTTWRPFNGVKGRYVHGIVIDPADTNRLFVYVDSAHSPIYRSEDAGASWSPVVGGLPASKPAEPIRMHGRHSDTLFYTGDTSGGSRLYLTEDSGDTWRIVGPALPKVWRLIMIE